MVLVRGTGCFEPLLTSVGRTLGVEGVQRQFMTTKLTVILHSKESAIVHCVIADSKTSKKG